MLNVSCGKHPAVPCLCTVVLGRRAFWRCGARVQYPLLGVRMMPSCSRYWDFACQAGEKENGTSLCSLMPFLLLLSSSFSELQIKKKASLADEHGSALFAVRVCSQKSGTLDVQAMMGPVRARSYQAEATVAATGYAQTGRAADTQEAARFIEEVRDQPEMHAYAQLYKVGWRPLRVPSARRLRRPDRSGPLRHVHTTSPFRAGSGDGAATTDTSPMKVSTGRHLNRDNVFDEERVTAVR